MSARALRQGLMALALAATLAIPAFAVQPDEVLADAALEARARALSAGLRCMVCQNQSIDDSDASLARDIRILIRERLVKGDSDSAIRDFLVSRYGDFILLKPPFEPQTWLLWLGAPLALGLGALAMIRFRRADAPPKPLSPEEERRLAELGG